MNGKTEVTCNIIARVSYLINYSITRTIAHGISRFTASAYIYQGHFSNPVYSKTIQHGNIAESGILFNVPLNISLNKLQMPY